MSLVAEERIVGVALHREGAVLCLPAPSRHHDLIRVAVRLGWGLVHVQEQGFLTSLGRFVTRRAAESIARAAGQVTGALIGSVLTSEDLW